MQKERVNYIVDNGIYVAYCVNIPALTVHANSFSEMHVSMRELLHSFLKDKQSLLETDEPFNFVADPDAFHDQKTKDLIIYALEDGIEEWKQDCNDWKHKFEAVAKSLTELVKLKEIKETQGKTIEYKKLKPNAWGYAKMLVSEITKIQSK